MKNDKFKTKLEHNKICKSKSVKYIMKVKMKWTKNNRKYISLKQRELTGVGGEKQMN